MAKILQQSGIEQSASVSGGEPRISGTRIPIWALEQTRRLGANQSEILRAYPSLHAEDLKYAWDYVRDHLEEIEMQIRENEEA